MKILLFLKIIYLPKIWYQLFASIKIIISSLNQVSALGTLHSIPIRFQNLRTLFLFFLFLFCLFIHISQNHRMNRVTRQYLQTYKKYIICPKTLAIHHWSCMKLGMGQSWMTTVLGPRPRHLFEKHLTCILYLSRDIFGSCNNAHGLLYHLYVSILIYHGGVALRPSKIKIATITVNWPFYFGTSVSVPSIMISLGTINMCIINNFVDR